MLLGLLVCASGALAHVDDGPGVTLWVWHGAQDLRGLHEVAGDGVRVAFLERTVMIEPGGLVVNPRRHALLLDDNTERVAVVHMEIDPRVSLGRLREMQASLLAEVARAYEAPGVSGVQVDFDAPQSMRGVYADLLRGLDEARPDGLSLEMTALGSWCTSDRWLRDVPVDRVVPMLFGPGHQSEMVRESLQAGPLPERRCRANHGLREADVIDARAEQVHVFPERQWTLQRALEVWEDHRAALGD